MTQPFALYTAGTSVAQHIWSQTSAAKWHWS